MVKTICISFILGDFLSCNTKCIVSINPKVTKNSRLCTWILGYSRLTYYFGASWKAWLMEPWIYFTYRWQQGNPKLCIPPRQYLRNMGSSWSSHFPSIIDQFYIVSIFFFLVNAWGNYCVFWKHCAFLKEDFIHCAILPISYCIRRLYWVLLFFKKKSTNLTAETACN